MVLLAVGTSTFQNGFRVISQVAVVQGTGLDGGRTCPTGPAPLAASTLSPGPMKAAGALGLPVLQRRQVTALVLCVPFTLGAQHLQKLRSPRTGPAWGRQPPPPTAGSSETPRGKVRVRLPLRCGTGGTQSSGSRAPGRLW